MRDVRIFSSKASFVSKVPYSSGAICSFDIAPSTLDSTFIIASMQFHNVDIIAHPE